MYIIIYQHFYTCFKLSLLDHRDSPKDNLVLRVTSGGCNHEQNRKLKKQKTNSRKQSKKPKKKNKVKDILIQRKSKSKSRYQPTT